MGTHIPTNGIEKNIDTKTHIHIQPTAQSTYKETIILLHVLFTNIQTETTKQPTNKQTETPCRETPDRSLLKPDWRPQNDPRLDEYLKYHSSILPRLTIKFCYRIFLLIVILV